MKSLVLVGLGNDEKDKRSYFILEKDEVFKKYFNEILEKLKLFPPIYDEQGSIAEFINQINHYKNNNFDLDVIYTSDKIILIVRAKSTDLVRFKSLILAYSKMEE